ncbi:hypothetical protein ACOSQ2_022518 [Xanthoceras sorbifolium]
MNMANMILNNRSNPNKGSVFIPNRNINIHFKHIQKKRLPLMVNRELRQRNKINPSLNEIELIKKGPSKNKNISMIFNISIMNKGIALTPNSPSNHPKQPIQEPLEH